MDTLTVWVFPTPSAAAAALPGLEETALALDASLDDIALVTWPQGRRKLSVRQLGALSGPGTLWGGFWGVLFGLIFLVPLADPMFGAAAGAFAGSLSELGFRDDFVERVRAEVVAGSSAIFVLSSGEAASRLGAATRELHATVLRCDLAPEPARRLHEALGEEGSRHVP